MKPRSANCKAKCLSNFWGQFRASEIPKLARSSHLMYCAEVNPPCPNSVIEALACGLPVIGFDSGSLKELVTDDAGCVVPYGANPWKLETPDISALAAIGGENLEKQKSIPGGGAAACRVRFWSGSNGRVLSQSFVWRIAESWIRKFTNFY